MAGRRPKPTALKVLAGNPGRRPLPPREPKPKTSRKAPPPPSGLRVAEVAAWRVLAPLLHDMGVLTEADGHALMRLVACYADVSECQAAIRKYGRVYETQMQNGEVMIRQRPEVSQLADADRRLRAYLIEFGLTPAARSRVQAATDDDEAQAKNYFGA